MPMLTPVPGATPTYDDDGNEVVEVVTCGTCGRSWNDAAVSDVTPAPSARCPFEYEHEFPDCDHKWRDYGTIGIVCRDCGADAPADMAEAITKAEDDLKGVNS